MLSLREKMKRNHTVIGWLFIAMGIIGIIVALTELVGIGVKAAGVFQLVSAVIVIVFVLYYYRADKLQYDAFDEMAEENYCKAKAKGYDFSFRMALCIVIFSFIALMLIDFEAINFNMINTSAIKLAMHVLFIFIGCSNVVVGKEFAALERV